MKDKEPIVSVCVQTYQHAKYIRECLDSILMQETDFPYEILLGEDESTDGTREICIEYAEKHPDKIRLFLNERKDVIYINGQPTGRGNLINNLKNARGKYIALCEGDDYWTNPKKLQTQIDFLENNPDYSICLHNTIIKFEGSDQQDKIAIVDPKEELCLEDFIDVDYLGKKGGLVSRGHTSSMIFRNHLIIEFPEWFCYKSLAADIYLQMLLAQYGKGKFINEFMSVYRVNSGGITRTNSVQRGYKLFENRISILKILNQHFHYRYDILIKSQIADFYLAKAKFFSRDNRIIKVASSLLQAVVYSQNKLVTLKEAIKIANKKLIFIHLFHKGYTKFNSFRKKRSERKNFIRKENEVAKILTQKEPPLYYDDEKVFQLLQSRYTPRDAYKYDHYHSWKRGVERASTMLTMPQLQKKGLTFLEVACGDGMTSYVFTTYGHTGHCHDIEDWRREEAKNLKFIQADLANQLPVEDQQYDLIFSFNSFEHIPNPELALKEISRIAKSGAIIYLEFGPLYNSPWGLHAYKTIYFPYPQFLLSEYFYVKKLKEIGIKDLGKDMETLQPLNKWSYKDFDALWSKFDLHVLRKERGQDYSHLDFILQYPDSFKGRELTIDEITTQWIRVVLLKK